MQVCNENILVDVDDDGEEEIVSESGIVISQAIDLRLQYHIISGIVKAVNGSAGESIDGIHLKEGSSRVWFARNKGLTMSLKGKVMYSVKLKDIIAVE